jgi:hypothetical protein
MKRLNWQVDVLSNGMVHGIKGQIYPVLPGPRFFATREEANEFRSRASKKKDYKVGQVKRKRAA